MLNAIHADGADWVTACGAGAAKVAAGLRRRAAPAAAETIVEIRMRIAPNRECTLLPTAIGKRHFSGFKR